MFITCGVCDGQNLVPNGDFEQYSGCPTNTNQLDSALFWINPSNVGTPDYFNQCALPISGMGIPYNFIGFQQAHSGTAYSGIALRTLFGYNYREFIEAPLISTLLANTCYYFEMYVNSSNNSTLSTDDIGIYFSDTVIIGINNQYPLPFTPQINNQTGSVFDTLNWTLVSGNYTAVGGENYVIIGNFKDDLITDTIISNNNAAYPGAYVYIEDVSLTLCTGIEEKNKIQK